MRKYLFTILLLIPLTTNATDFLVWYFTPDVRVVLTQLPCATPDMGLQATAQRIDGSHIKGCWKKETEDNIRITWRNNAKDYAILRLRDFKPSKE